MQRRDFVGRLAAASAAFVLAQTAGAQQGAAPASGANSNLFDMNQEAAKTVRRAPKPGATKSMSDEDRDGAERQIRCQCGCTLDVYICRTTDFSCQVSPAMHRDIISLVDGGYSAQEIIDSFVQVYGERALMAPKHEGFNLAAYWLPAAAIGAGALALVGFLRRMQERTVPVAANIASPSSVSGTDDEMARLQAAIRRDD